MCGHDGPVEPAWFGSRAPGERRGRRCVDRDACLIRLMQPTTAELELQALRARKAA